MSSCAARVQPRSDTTGQANARTEQATTAAKDKDYIKCPQFTGDNFPMWKNKVSMFLRVKRLLKCIKTPMSKDPSETEVNKYAEAACILGGHISDEVYNHIINSKNITNAYSIWQDLRQEYASSTVLAIF
jgi:hypothetical protein